MEGIQTYLKQAVDESCSDLFVSAGKAVAMKRGDVISPAGDETLTPERAEALVRELYTLAGRSIDRYLAHGDDDFSLSVSGLARFRVSAYRQRGTMAAVIRVVRFGIPDWQEMGILEEVMRVADITGGLVLVTGPAGGGKSTTLACIVDAINRRRSAHIITIEDPIEYLHRDEKGYISQRELAVDTDDYAAALRAGLRQAPDVILLGELDGPDIIRLAMTAAESGHLVISTLRTMGAVNTVDHIIEQFLPQQQQTVRLQLAKVLKTVVSQQLLPAVGGGLAPAFEVMHLDNAVRGMIREGRTEQINSVIQGFAMSGMIGMDESILRLYKAGKISREAALQFAVNEEQLQRKL